MDTISNKMSPFREVDATWTRWGVFFLNRCAPKKPTKKQRDADAAAAAEVEAAKKKSKPDDDVTEVILTPEQQAEAAKKTIADMSAEAAAMKIQLAEAITCNALLSAEIGRRQLPPPLALKAPSHTTSRSTLLPTPRPRSRTAPLALALALAPLARALALARAPQPRSRAQHLLRSRLRSFRYEIKHNPYN